MVCYSPIRAYRATRKNANGKRPISFTLKDGYVDMPLLVPCGQCLGCRLTRSRNWAARCVHEASLYDRNCFLTLTYNDDHLPSDLSLHFEHVQKFMHDLRQKFPNDKIRYFLCGEYGEQYERPHYHILLFNFSFPDVKLWCYKNRIALWTSEILNSIWKHGYCIIGDVNFQSAAYVARYVLKKITGDKADDHYHGRVPEFCSMSLRPGIGHDWIEKYATDVLNTGFLVVRSGSKTTKLLPPPYYDKFFEQYYPEAYKEMKRNRKNIVTDYMIDDSKCIIDHERLEAKLKVKYSRIERLIRTL